VTDTPTTAPAALDAEQIAEYRALLAAVTPGAWTVKDTRDAAGAIGNWLCILSQPRVYAPRTAWKPVPRDYGANAEFIAAAPEMVAALLAEVARLTAANDVLARDNLTIASTLARAVTERYVLARDGAFWSGRTVDLRDRVLADWEKAQAAGATARGPATGGTV
jgi:hypothetical protein